MAPLERRVGKTARVCSDLKPTGKVVVDRDRYLARFQGGLVRQGEEIRIVAIEGDVLVVDGGG